MQTTPYYELNIVEGTDIVNPLVVDNPNYEKIDGAMHDNAIAGVTIATEVGNASVHALTRENEECAVIRFIATTNWKSGDTVTVDGVPVTALLPSGETLPDGAYVINANVLCVLTGTNLTVFAERKKTENAVDVVYKDSNVQDALDTINAKLDDGAVFSQVITPYTQLKNIGDGFTIAEIDERVRVVTITEYTTSNNPRNSLTMHVNRFKTAGFAYLGAGDSDYKVFLNLTGKTLDSAGTSTAAYGVYVEIIGY